MSGSSIYSCAVAVLFPLSHYLQSGVLSHHYVYMYVCVSKSPGTRSRDHGRTIVSSRAVQQFFCLPLTKLPTWNFGKPNVTLVQCVLLPLLAYVHVSLSSKDTTASLFVETHRSLALCLESPRRSLALCRNSPRPRCLALCRNSPRCYIHTVCCTV